MRYRSSAPILAALAALATLATPRPARAQLLQAEPPRVGPRVFGGAELVYAEPVGDFKRYVDHGWGASGHALVAFDRASVLALRLDGGFINYGSEKKTACISTTIGCRVAVDVNTTNNIAYFGVGPQLMAPDGHLRPYLNGTVGGSFFWTQSSLEGSDNSSSFAQTTNFRDFVFSAAVGAGLYVPLRGGPNPISLDLGARYNWNERTRYLREGSIVDFPDGSIAFRPIESRTDLVTWKVGVTFGAR